MEPKEASEELRSYLESLGVTLKATFVPFSKSRNHGEKHPSVNWRVRVERRGRGSAIVTDYMQGCGHLKGYVSGHSIMHAECVRQACEMGKGWKAGLRMTAVTPSLEDVVSSLSLDSSVTDAPFEDWACEFGYDPDSRKAEGIYNACREIAAGFCRLFDHTERERIAELTQDM